jgi:hypothetical protein
MFSSLAKAFSAKKVQKPATKLKKAIRSLQLENMEARQLMAVTNIRLDYSSTYNTDQVFISTDTRASNVTISLLNNQIVVKDSINGFNRSLPATGIDAIVFSGNSGNDRVEQKIAGMQLRAYGYGGNDTLIGNSGKDLLDGGANDDYIYGNSGADKLIGGSGVDRIYGGWGNDNIVGGSDGDYLYGEGDNDYIYGESGHDTLDGGSGNDHLYGGTNNDRLLGGSGVDKLYGQEDNDYLHGGSSTDELYGGSGVDTFRRSLTYVNGFYLTTPADEKNDNREGVRIQDYSSEDSPWDVEQESTPTCAILSAISAVAMKNNSTNDLVKKIQFDSANDRYGIRIFHNGAWTTQWVNADWTEGRDPSRDLWVTLYQKAYLQAWGVQTRDGHGRLLESSKWVSTKGTSWQNPGIAMDAIAPGYSKWTSMANAVASTIRTQTRDSNVYGLVASSKDSGTANGVVANHGYAIYDAFTQNNVWMIRLYNPWGHDQSGAATDGRNDGLITLTWTQFKANFKGYYRNV